MVSLKTDFAGIELENPLIVAAGSCTRTMDQLKRVEENGAGAVVIKSTLLDEEYCQAITPTNGLYPEARLNFANLEGIGYFAVSGLSQYPAEKWAEFLEKGRKDIKIPVIACPIAITMDGYIKIAHLFQDAGIDAIQLCFSAPLLAMRKSFEELKMAGYHVSANPNLIYEISKTVKEEVNIPVGAKIVPVGLNFTPSVMAAKKAKLDFIHICTVGGAHPGIDVETGKPLSPFKGGAMVGHFLKYQNFRTVMGAAMDISFKDIHLTASGGVMDWRDVVQYIMFGCSSVQMNSVVMKKGYKEIGRIKRDLLDYMERKGYQTIYDFQGKGLENLLGIDDVLRKYWDTKGLITPEINRERCDLCGICEETCLLQAITINKKKGEIYVDKSRCEGDALCMANCPMEAVKMQNLELLFG